MAQAIQFSTAGLAALEASMRKYLAQKQARQLAEQRLQAAYGTQTAVDGADLAYLKPAGGESQAPA